MSSGHTCTHTHGHTHQLQPGERELPHGALVLCHGGSRSRPHFRPAKCLRTHVAVVVVVGWWYDLVVVVSAVVVVVVGAVEEVVVAPAEVTIRPALPRLFRALSTEEWTRT